ncbi:MAG: 30S ribosomal protein S4 [Asgard group archaeon]|nr:30S ribosomal protein S4 [Asgard group archaeon]
MGGIRRQRKKIITPGHPYDQARLERELPLVGEYGLRNKRELWKARTVLSKARQQARGLLALDPDIRSQRERELLSRLSRFGMLSESADLDSVLALDVKTVLDRRLQTIVFRIGLASTPYQARQFISHRHIAIDKGVVTSPSRLITVKEESGIAYAPRSPLNNPQHPSRPQAPPVVEEPEKTEKPRPKAKPAPKEEQRKPAPKEEQRKPAPKEEQRKPAPKEEQPRVIEKKAEVKPKEVEKKAEVKPKEVEKKAEVKPKEEQPKPKPTPTPEVKEAPKEKKPPAKPIEEKSKVATIADLSQIEGIGAKTAMLLQDHGFKTAQKIAGSSVDDITKVPGIGPATAEKMIKNAKALVKKAGEGK